MPHLDGPGAPILVIVDDEDDRNSLRSELGSRCRVLTPATAEAALVNALIPAPRWVVMDTFTAASSIPAVLRLHCQYGTRLILRPRAVSRSLMAIRSLIDSGLPVSIALQPVRGVGAGIAALLADPDPGPVTAMLRVALPLRDERVWQYVAVAAAAGRDGASVTRYAAFFGEAVRTVELHCHRLGLPSPRRLLDWTRCIWGLWRLQRWEWTLKRASAMAGFHDRNGLNRCLRRLRLMRFGDRNSPDPIERALTLFAMSLTPPPPPPAPRGWRPNPAQWADRAGGCG